MSKPLRIIGVRLKFAEISELILRVVSDRQNIKLPRLKLVPASFPGFSRMAYHISLKVKVILRNKGSDKFCYGFLIYTKHTTRKTKMWWKYLKLSSSGCRGSIITFISETFFL